MAAAPRRHLRDFFALPLVGLKLGLFGFIAVSLVGWACPFLAMAYRSSPYLKTVGQK